jgi:signal transduction histidine kinase
VLAINTMVTALCFPMTGGLSEATWSGMFRALLASALYVNTLGTASAVIIPRLLARFEGYGRGARLTVQVGAALAILALGFPTVPVLMVAIGLIDTNDYLELAVPLDWPVYALFAAVIVTIGITLYEGMNRDLQAKLRTKERDEAVARRLAAEAQLASLESRVQPHFLFNALNSIAALIPADPGRAERMVGQVASLLRSSLDGSSSLVPLEEELRVVRDYLDVERVRFGDRLRYQLDLADAAAAVAVPRLAVQTLVENAVKYAVSPRRSGASLTIRASAADGIARVEVQDDGAGFSEADVSEGHGLALLRSRLAMLFGEEGRLMIDSGPNGTKATLELPA